MKKSSKCEIKHGDQKRVSVNGKNSFGRLMSKKTREKYEGKTRKNKNTPNKPWRLRREEEAEKTQPMRAASAGQILLLLISQIRRKRSSLSRMKIKSLEDVLKDPNQTFGWQANSDVLLLNNVDEVSGPKDKLSKKHVFVLDFFGDVQASQTMQLREEVTGLLRSAKKERGDEVILRLKRKNK